MAEALLAVEFQEDIKLKASLRRRSGEFLICRMRTRLGDLLKLQLPLRNGAA